ncbi:hypothetical protein [Microbacterium sp. UCD-TDU]|uniref:hypothetical protein n=1 Tax=Microbacterium sp. UCD-TDU TaxID=1247714 RepID=UPI001F1667C0|nr:hypothetical protein [Microbacterium sp. UCD-TDU]
MGPARVASEVPTIHAAQERGIRIDDAGGEKRSGPEDADRSTDELIVVDGGPRKGVNGVEVLDREVLTENPLVDGLCLTHVDVAIAFAGHQEDGDVRVRCVT